MIAEEKLSLIQNDLKTFAAQLFETYDLDYFDIDMVKTMGNKFHITLVGVEKVAAPDREKLIHYIGTHGLPMEVLDPFEFAGKTIQIIDVKFGSKPFVVRDQNSGELYQITLREVQKVFNNTLLNHSHKTTKG